MIRSLVAMALLAVPALCGPATRQNSRPHLLPLPSPQLATYRLLEREAGRYGIGHRVTQMHRCIYRESRFNPEVRNRRSGAAGIAQFMPRTFAFARRGAGLPETATPYDPEQAVRAMAWLWSQPHGDDNWRATR